jgi:hypothetical protein
VSDTKEKKPLQAEHPKSVLRTFPSFLPQNNDKTSVNLLMIADFSNKPEFLSGNVFTACLLIFNYQKIQSFE